MTIFFDAIVGQETAIAALQNILRSGQISQSYILSGEKGSGKQDLAMAFAAALQCTNPSRESGRIQACGRCRSCRQILAGSHPDLITVTNEWAGVQTKSGTIGVKTARFVQTDVGVRPGQGEYKIYVIPNAQNLNQQAQNALLKTLEEPPSYAVFLLLSENTSAFLPTVRSRSVQIPLKAVSEEALLAMLKAQGITGENASLSARLSHGNPGRCLELACSEEKKRLRTRMKELFRKMPQVTSLEIAAFSESLVPNKKEGDSTQSGLEEFLDLGRSWFRDLLVAKTCGADPDRLIFQDEIQYINMIAARISMTALEAILRAFDQADRCRAAKVNEVQIAETLLLQIRRAMSDPA